VFSMLLAKKCLALRLCGAAIFVQQNGAQEWSIFLPWLKVLGNARTMVGDIWPILMRKGGPMLSTLKFCWSIFPAFLLFQVHSCWVKTRTRPVTAQPFRQVAVAITFWSCLANLRCPAKRVYILYIILYIILYSIILYYKILYYMIVYYLILY
jgi:hypothetical protein